MASTNLDMDILRTLVLARQLGGFGRAAERVGRKFRGLDIDPAYVEVAMERWSQITGGEPTLVQRSDHEAAA